MKIYDVNLTGTGAAETGAAQEAQRAQREQGMGTAGASGAGSTAADHIELSNTLNSLGRAISTYSSDRAAKVQALTAQYRSGTYSVNSLATSRAMVASALSPAGR